LTHAVQGARETPTLDVGCHLVLVGGRSLVAPFRELPKSVPELLVALVKREIDAGRELRAQIETVAAGGIEPTHLDTHKHTHLSARGPGRRGAAGGLVSNPVGAAVRLSFR